MSEERVRLDLGCVQGAARGLSRVVQPSPLGQDDLHQPRQDVRGAVVSLRAATDGVAEPQTAVVKCAASP